MFHVDVQSDFAPDVDDTSRVTEQWDAIALGQLTSLHRRDAVHWRKLFVVQMHQHVPTHLTNPFT
jgi:hypothetical protein